MSASTSGDEIRGPVPGSTEPGVRGQIAFVHILRGVAAMLVVWSHLSGYWLSETGRTSAAQDLWYQVLARPLHLYQNAGHLGVVLFFLISGYIITHTSLREDRRSFFIKRTLRIFPALIIAIFLTWVIVTVAATAGLHVVGLHGAEWWRWILAAFLLDGFFANAWVLDVTWTLVVELIFYALIFAVIRRQRTAPLATTWVMAGIWLALSLLFLNVGALAENANSWVAYWVGFLIIGRVIYLVQRGLARPVDGVILGATVLFAFTLIVETVDPGFLLTPGGWPGVEPLVTYALALLIFISLLRLAPRRVVPPFGFFGDISYSLYLVHLPVGMLTLAVLDLLSIPETVLSFLAIGVSIAIAWVLWLGVERPSQRLARLILGSRDRRRSPVG